MKNITPTVGRKVWFFPNGGQVKTSVGLGLDSQFAPYDATIAHVWDDHCINIGILDANGRPIPVPPTSVILVQPGDDTPGLGQCYCTWMPYQVKKTTGSESGESAAGTAEI